MSNMRSIPRDWERQIPALRWKTARRDHPPTEPVWVRLDVLFAHDPARHQAVVDGLELSGNARGLLLGWKRGSLGDWLAVVNYQIHYADGRAQSTIWHEQLIPASAISPREDNHPLGSR